jgi:hypothetical protein
MISNLFSAEEVENLSSDSESGDISLMVDFFPFSNKPDDSDIPQIIHRMRVRKTSVLGIAFLAASGHTFRPGILVGGTTGKFWEFQQIFFVDIEHGYTVSQSIAICERVGIVPNIIYPTFNYRPNGQRYRLVFITPKPIYDPNVRDDIQKILTALFHGDEKTFDKARLFFGGNFCFRVDKQARLDVPRLLILRKEGTLHVA